MYRKKKEKEINKINKTHIIEWKLIKKKDRIMLDWIERQLIVFGREKN